MLRSLRTELRPAAAAIAFVLATLSHAVGAEPPVFGLHRLRCEYLTNPLGIDVARPRLSWQMVAARRVRGQSAFRILVASSPDRLLRDEGDLWDSGRVRSRQTAWIEYGGRPLTSGQRAFWKVRAWSDRGAASPWSAPASWTMGLLRSSDWSAQWIGQRRPDHIAEGTPLPSPWLRKSFALATRPARAVASVNPLGYYELYVNGRKVDDHVLSPAVTDFSKRTLYVTHDVTDHLVEGRNVVSLWLGRGWYVRGHPGVVHDGPLVRAQLDLTMDDGRVDRVVTDTTWKVRSSPLSPIGRGTAFGDYGGEHYDAAQDRPGWNAADLDDSAWQDAAAFVPPDVPATAQMVEPNRIVETIAAARVDAHPAGGWVVDMGRDFTGWLQVVLPALPEGTVVTLEYSDQAEPDEPAPGAAPKRVDLSPFPYTFNQRDTIVAAGRPLTFRSRFNYHAFRHVRLLGLASAPLASSLTGYAIRTAYDRVGTFESSNTLLNDIHRMVTRTYEALTLGGYVVDCPTRERLGYGGDAGTSMETGMLNFDVGGLYASWLANWRDAQAESGSLPHTAPNYPEQGGGGPMWGGFVVTLPWQMYLQYGDRRVLETNYPMIRRWLAYLDAETEGDLLLRHTSHAIRDEWNFLGDWLTPKGSFRGGTPPAQQINSVHFVYQLQLAARIARVLGAPADAEAFESRATAVSSAVHRRFYNTADSTYTTGDAIQLAFPLLTGVVPPALRPDVRDALEHVIRVRNGGRLDTGMHGTYFLLKYLLEAGRSDLVFGMTNTTEYPGWGYMLAKGATTSWESWTGDSHIHDTLISIGAWFTQGLGGIRSDGVSPGFEHFVIGPSVVGDLSFVKARYQSIHGEIASNWRVDGGVFTLDVTVPPGTTATVVVPGEGRVRTLVRRSSRTADAGARRYVVAAGTHRFETTLGARR